MYFKFCNNLVSKFKYYFSLCTLDFGSFQSLYF